MIGFVIYNWACSYILIEKLGLRYREDTNGTKVMPLGVEIPPCHREKEEKLVGSERVPVTCNSIVSSIDVQWINFQDSSARQYFARGIQYVIQMGKLYQYDHQRG